MPPKVSPYVLSPAGVAGAGLESTHRIKNRRPETELNAEGANKYRANAPRSPFEVSLTPFVEKELYSGANGTTYIVKVTDALLKMMDSARREAGHRVIGESPPRLGTRIVMKVAKRKPRDSWPDFLAENVREASVHRELTKSDISTCIKIPCASAFQCAGNYVPAFFIGFLNGGKAKSPAYVTFMGYAGEMTLHDYLTTRRMTAEVYANFEIAACAMWAAGFVHGDLHRKNAMIDPATKKVTIIDLGFGVKLPDDMRSKIRERIAQIVDSDDGGSAGDMWTDLGVTAYANRIMTARGFPSWYNPDGRSLVTMFNSLSRSEKERLPEVRRALWGCERRPAGGSDTTEEGEIRPARTPPAGPPPAANNKLSRCRQKCEAQGKFCNPATFRCVKNRPVANRPANRPAENTPRNLSAMAKKIKKIPAGGLRKLLDERRAKCRAQGKTYNPATSRCVAKKPSPAANKPCKQDCDALGKQCNPRTGRCIKA
jgi:serine/threonine protein kinase